MIRTLIRDDPGVRFVEPSLYPGMRREMWDNIQKETARAKKKPPRFLRSRRFLIWSLGAAAVVAALFVISPLFVGKSRETDFLTIIRETDFDPTAGDVLVKSGNHTVKVEADRADVVYEGEGKLTVNSQEIAPRGEDEKVARASAWRKEEVRMDRVMVSYGKTAYLKLDDGTKIWVNSGSQLIYPSTFARDKREVFLVGEAYFEVAEDAARPFILKSNDLNVEVLGTRFNVSAYGDEVMQTVVLVSGSVDVSDVDGKISYQMDPDQMFSYDRTLGKAGIRTVDVEQYISWIHGYHLLRDESLDVLFTRIGRHFNVRFNYDPAQMQGISFGGKLDLVRGLEQVLDTISTTTPIEWRHENGEVIVELSKP